LSGKRTLTIAAVFASAIAAGGLLAVIVTMAGRAVASPTDSSPTAAVQESAPASLAATLQAAESPASAAPASPTASPNPSATAAADISVAAGCFTKGIRQPEGEPVQRIEAPDLANRLPFLSALSDRNAWVGSSLTAGLEGAYVNGFETCLDADPATIRWGHSTVGSSLGVIPMGAQVDGYTGPQLAEVLIGGFLGPEQFAALETREHDGWTYLYVPDWSFAVTASADTVYWMQSFCCVDVMDDDAELPTFEEIIEHYLDNIFDKPAAWSVDR
jgi:hypothetical protein